MNRMRALPLALCLAATGISGAAEKLRFDFDDPAHLGAQSGGLPEGSVVGPISAGADSGSADFHGGVIKVTDFPGPQGPFTIEARFKLRHYGPEDSRFIGDILTTATWNSHPPLTEGVPTQGFSFRVGGSYGYPVLPRDRYRTESEWLAAQDAWSHIDRGRLAVCFADFAIARRDIADWKNAYTDRCIETNAWTHLAAVWDGAGMRLYLNGVDATDTLRLYGMGAPSRIDSVETAFVGARADDSYDPRDFDGEIDFVRLEDRALSAAEIHERYKGTFVPARRDSLCHGMVIPAYPEAGRVCAGSGLRFEVKVANHGACTDPAFIAHILAGDSVEIEVAKDPAFDSVALRARFAGLAFEPGAALLAPLAGYRGPLYWRVRLIPAAGTETALAKTAAVTAPEWSPSRPIVVDLAATTALARSAPRLLRAEAGLLLRSAGEPVLYDLSGRRVPARFHRLPSAAGEATGWRLEAVAPGTGLLLAR